MAWNNPRRVDIPLKTIDRFLITCLHWQTLFANYISAQMDDKRCFEEILTTIFGITAVWTLELIVFILSRDKLNCSKISEAGELSREWPEGSLFNSYYTEVSRPGLLHFTLDPYLIMLSVKQDNIKYNFLGLWYDSIWNWTPGLPDHWRTPSYALSFNV